MVKIKIKKNMGNVRKWSEKDIKIKLYNLRKRIPLSVIQQEVKFYKHIMQQVLLAQ